MKKQIIILTVLFNCASFYAQKYFTKTGETEFKASVETFEPVEAKSNSSTAILDTKTGNIACLIFIKSFHFKVALMQEHFNENYMDSDKFPKAYFNGKIEDFSITSLTNKPKSFKLSGELTIHGISKEINTIINIHKKNNTVILASSKFIVKPDDFEIEIPKIVSNKISNNILINIHYELQKKQ